MRKFEAIIGTAIWIAVATLMPMSALQPVDGAAAQAAAPLHAAASPSSVSL